MGRRPARPRVGPVSGQTVEAVRSLSDLPGVADAVEEARAACTALRWHEGLRRRIERGSERDLLEALRTRPIAPASGSHLTAMRASLPARLKRLLTHLEHPALIAALARQLEATSDPAQPTRDALLLLHLGAVRFAS